MIKKNVNEGLEKNMVEKVRKKASHLDNETLYYFWTKETVGGEVAF